MRTSCLRSTSLSPQLAISTSSLLEHMKKRKNKASVGDIGHFDKEEGLEGMKVDNIKPQVVCFMLKSWRKTKAYKNDVYLLKVAKLHLPVLGDELAVLSKEGAHRSQGCRTLQGPTTRLSLKALWEKSRALRSDADDPYGVGQKS